MKRSGFGTSALAALATIAAMTWTTPSEAQEAGGLGAKGQLLVSADRLFPLFSYSRVSVTRTEAGRELTSSVSGSSLVMLVGTEPELGTVHTIPRVAVDYTIIDRLTLGGSVALAFGLGGTTKTDVVNGNTITTRESDAPTRNLIGISPRVGYIFPMGDVLAFWLRGGFSFYSAREKRTVFQGNNNIARTETDKDTVLSLDFDPQLMIVPIPHFFFHVGPIINLPVPAGSRTTEVSAGPTTTSTSYDLHVFHFGVSTGIGGWFDL